MIIAIYHGMGVYKTFTMVFITQKKVLKKEGKKKSSSSSFF
jgi:hypothetical protein